MYILSHFLGNDQECASYKVDNKECASRKFTRRVHNES